ncbi:MAG: FG-GAP repeat protein [Planctomycetota bacterium]
MPLCLAVAFLTAAIVPTPTVLGQTCRDGTIRASDGAAGDQFGISVGFDGTRAIVGARAVRTRACSPPHASPSGRAR